MTGTPGIGKAKVAVATVLLLAATAVALPSAAVEPQHSRNAIQTGDDLMDNIYTDCLNKGSVSCVKYKLFSFVDKVLSSKDSFSLTEGVTVVKTPGAVAADGAPRSLSADDIQKQDMDSLVANRMERFLSTHTLKLDLKGTEVLDAVSSAGRALGDAADSLGLTEEEDDEVTGRKKVKKAGKVLLPLLLMMKMKAAALIPIALGAIALIAGKALLIGKIALLLASIIGLKKLLSQQHKSVTYEIVSHPHHSSSHEHHHDSFSSGGGGDIGYGGGHGGWGRSGDGQEMAYRAYQHQPKTQ